MEQVAGCKTLINAATALFRDVHHLTLIFSLLC